MRLNEVINRFALVSGLEPEEVSKWTVLCMDAVNEMKRLVLGSTKYTEENILRLSNGAGVLAYYKYCLYSHSSKVKGFTAGNVDITMSEDEMSHAEKLWKAERQALSDLISQEGDFCFQGVRA